MTWRAMLHHGAWEGKWGQVSRVQGEQAVPITPRPLPHTRPWPVTLKAAVQEAPGLAPPVEAAHPATGQE